MNKIKEIAGDGGAHEGFLFQGVFHEGKIHVLPKTFSPLDPSICNDRTREIAIEQQGG
jgi:hypothetical protein